MSEFPKHWTVGAAGHGANAPDPRGGYRTRPDLCAEHGHPGVTYNPWMDKTWCLCGEVITEGDTVEFPVASSRGGCLTSPLEVAP